MKSLLSLSVFIFSTLTLLAGEDPVQTPNPLPQFGPFVGLTVDESVIQGVMVDDEDKIWIMLNPKFRNDEILLKISTDYKAGYRNWYTGEPTLVSPAGQNKAPNEWTDWIRTSSNYIEYWMGDKLVLHLKRK